MGMGVLTGYFELTSGGKDQAVGMFHRLQLLKRAELFQVVHVFVE